MTTTLHLHSLQGDKRAGELAALVDQLFRAGQRLVIWVADEGRRQILDDYLWTFRKLSFVPHALWGPDQGEVNEPVVLVGTPANPNGAATLVIGDDLPPGEWAASFEQVHDLIPAGTSGDERSGWWQAWQRDHHCAGP